MFYFVRLLRSKGWENLKKRVTFSFYSASQQGQQSVQQSKTFDFLNYSFCSPCFCVFKSGQLRACSQLSFSRQICVPVPTTFLLSIPCLCPNKFAQIPRMDPRASACSHTSYDTYCLRIGNGEITLCLLALFLRGLLRRRRPRLP